MSMRKFDRSRSEIGKIEKSLPHLNVLSSILKRVSTSPPEKVDDTDGMKLEMWHAYNQLHQAMTRISRLDDGITSEVTEWDRLR